MTTTHRAARPSIALALGLALSACSGGDDEGGDDDGADGDASAEGADAGLDAPLDGVPGEHALTFDGRDYVMYVPSGYDVGTPIPLVVAFHGACKTGREFYDHDGIVAWKEAAEPARYVLVVPDTKGGCASADGFCADFVLWPPTCEPSDSAPEIRAEMDGVVAMIDEIGRHYRLDRAGLHAMGHSDGGLFTGIGGFARTDVFASLTVFAMGWGAGYPLVEPARTIPVQFICGGDDPPFCPAAQESEPWLAARGHPTRLEVIPGEGHGLEDLVVTMTVDDLFGWMREHEHPAP